MSLNQTRAQKIRGALLSIAQNESVFLFVAFVSYSFLSTNVLAWYADSIAAFNRFVVLPWGGALCLLRLCRAQERKLEPHADIRFLVLLYAWIVVPFGIRFGLTAINANDWFHCMVAFFGVYALITEETVQRREMLLDVAGALFAALSFVMGALLLYCAFTVQTFGTELSETPFGIYENMYFLSAGFHYNTTGMFAVCCTLMSLLGVARHRHPLAKLAHLIPSLMMAAVVVLSQSRTARYSMLAVLVGGYMGAAVMTDSAIRHYESVSSGKKEASVFASAVAEEAQQPEAQPDEPQAADKQELLGRGFGDMTFTDRTTIWGKVIAAWLEEPKNMVIGFGLGKISAITDGMTTHNAYLGFITNYGLIGFALLCCFFGSMAGPMCRAFFAPKGRAHAGDRVLAMIVVAALLTSLMESEPLGAMSPMNAVMMFSMAMLTARGRDLKTA